MRSLVVTSWLPEGSIHETCTPVFPEQGSVTPSVWHSAQTIRPLFASHSVPVDVTEHTLSFRAASAEAWFAEQEQNHPFWSQCRTEKGSEWSTLRSQIINILERGNEVTEGYQTTSTYLLTQARKPSA